MPNFDGTGPDNNRRCGCRGGQRNRRGFLGCRKQAQNVDKAEETNLLKEQLKSLESSKERIMSRLKEIEA